MRFIKTLITITVLLVAVTTIADGKEFSSVDGNNPSLITYQFTGKIERYSKIYAPFPLATDEIITGTFSYFPMRGIQKFPAGARINIGSVILNADLNIKNDPFKIKIEYKKQINSLSHLTHDVFMWTLNDTEVASQYGTDRIQAIFYLEDTTATVFHDNKVPIDLNLDDFNHHLIVFNRNGPEKNACSWFCDVIITSLTRME
jgi:hypothetical protein